MQETHCIALVIPLSNCFDFCYAFWAKQRSAQTTQWHLEVYLLTAMHFTCNFFIQPDEAVPTRNVIWPTVIDRTLLFYKPFSEHSTEGVNCPVGINALVLRNSESNRRLLRVAVIWVRHVIYSQWYHSRTKRVIWWARGFTWRTQTSVTWVFVFEWLFNYFTNSSPFLFGAWMFAILVRL
jgi:hypothetical protein